MIIFAIAALAAFGGYLITIPRLIYDEWSFWRARKAEQPATPSGEEQKYPEVHTWKPLITM